MTTDPTNAAEKTDELRELAACKRLPNQLASGIFAYASASKDGKETAWIVEGVADWYAEQAAEIEKLTAERDHANLFTQVVLSSLHWTGEGYEWTGGRYDYRMQPSEPAALTTSEIERLRSEAKEHAAERTMLMTALDGLLNDFIKAVPSSEPIDCAKFTRYQPALLAYVTVRDRKRGANG